MRTYVTILGITLALLGQCASADNAQIDPDMAARLMRQMSDLTPSTPGQNALPDDAYMSQKAAMDPSQFSPFRMVKVTHYEGKHLVGYADYDQVKALVGDQFEPVIRDFKAGPFELAKGVPISIFVDESDDLVGCSCPTGFREIVVMALVKDPGWEKDLNATTAHSVIIYIATNHLKRQESLVHKFSQFEQFVGLPKTADEPDHIRFLRSGSHTYGIEMRDEDGHVVFDAHRPIGWIPEPRMQVPLGDYLVYSAGGTFVNHASPELDLFNLNGFVMAPSYFRFQEAKHWVSFDPAAPTPPVADIFVPYVDSLSYDHQSDIGKILDQVKFKPLSWYAENFSNDANSYAMAWIPKAKAK